MYATHGTYVIAGRHIYHDDRTIVVQVQDLAPKIVTMTVSIFVSTERLHP